MTKTSMVKKKTLPSARRHIEYCEERTMEHLWLMLANR